MIANGFSAGEIALYEDKEVLIADFCILPRKKGIYAILTNGLTVNTRSLRKCKTQC